MRTYQLYDQLRQAPSDVLIPYWSGDDSIEDVRTLANRVLKFQVALPEALTDYGKFLLKAVPTDVYSSHYITRLDSEMRLKKFSPSALHTQSIANACANSKELLAASLENMTVAICREQPFHHDETMAESHAYVVLCLAQSGPMSFHTMGTEVPLHVGDLLVFDAQNPHALLRSGVSTFDDNYYEDVSHGFVFALGSVQLTAELRELLGIVIEPMPATTFRSMRDVDYSECDGLLSEKENQPQVVIPGDWSFG